MKLTKVHVREFKSIRDSNEYEVGNVTCLVGKNEAGKTALLEALYRLNPIVPAHAKFDVTEDYPRAEVEEYQFAVESKKRVHATPIEVAFALERKEMEGPEDEFGKGVFKTPTVTVSRQYASSNLFVHVEVDEAAAVKHVVSSADLPAAVSKDAAKQATLKALASFLETRAKDQEAAYNTAVQEANALAEPQRAQALDSAQELAESQAAKQLRAKLPELTSVGLGIYIWKKYLTDFLPKFLYFDEYYQMEGQVNVQSLKQRQANGQLKDSDRPMIGLIDLARLNLDQLLSPQNTQALINKLEGASNYLSKQIFKYWSQNQKLSVRFDIRPGLPGDPEEMRDGTNLWGFVYDSAHEVTIRLGTRSRGFIWFFSFLAWFSQQRRGDTPMILLLDEPGLFLHASAQGDLLLYIEEELKPHHQVVFTTHSPFMIDPHHFERVRIVRDKSMERRDDEAPLPDDERGTKVLADVLEADEGSLFPLQGALAYDLTQTLFIGPNTLLVEGVSDMFYIDGMTALLERAGRKGLSSKWTQCPVGGSDKVATFVALFRSQKGMNIATLIDFQKKDQQKIENIHKQKLLQKKQVLTFVQFTKTSEADVEDMFEPAFYLELVNNEYKADIAKPITEADLPPHPRILVRLEKYFEANPLKSGARFNHYRPARYFVEHADDLAANISAATTKRFEDAFEALNKLAK